MFEQPINEDPLVRLGPLEGEELEAGMRLLSHSSLCRVFMFSSIQWSMFTADSQFVKATKLKKAANKELLRRLDMVPLYKDRE